jgi:peptidoglycan hydrolase-like protein with peptidoglycan-binding domain
LPGRISQNTSNCLEISRRDEELSGRSEPLVQAIQLGLSAYGLNSGRPDGIKGPKTEAAIGQFADRQGLDPTASLESVFTALFGMRPDRMARLGLAAAKDCAKLALVPPPKREKPRVSKTRKPQRSYDDYDEADEARDEAIDRAIGIGIGIGLGVLGDRMHRDRRHDRGKNYEHGWED